MVNFVLNFVLLIDASYNVHCIGATWWIVKLRAG